MQNPKTHTHGIPISLHREGFRVYREGFPISKQDQFDWGAYGQKKSLFESLRNGELSPGALGIGGSKVTADKVITYATIALEHIEKLVSAQDGLRPTLYQLAASVSFDDRIGGINSQQFCEIIRVLNSAWFSKKDKAGGPLWSGSVKNLYDGITYSLDAENPELRGKSIAQGVLYVIAHKPDTLLTSRELIEALKLSMSPKNSAKIISPILQLLQHTGDILRHPDHVQPLVGNAPVSVWSNTTGPWKKPPITNVDQTVLQHAAMGNGWLYELSTTVTHTGNRFSNHSIKASARKLSDQGLLSLLREFPGSEDLPPSGHRLYDRVEITPAGHTLAKSWLNTPIGGLLTREAYDPLRSILISRTIAPSSPEIL